MPCAFLGHHKGRDVKSGRTAASLALKTGEHHVGTASAFPVPEAVGVSPRFQIRRHGLETCLRPAPAIVRRVYDQEP